MDPVVRQGSTGLTSTQGPANPESQPGAAEIAALLEQPALRPGAVQTAIGLASAADQANLVRLLDLNPAPWARESLRAIFAGLPAVDRRIEVLRTLAEGPFGSRRTASELLAGEIGRDGRNAMRLAAALEQSGPGQAVVVQALCLLPMDGLMELNLGSFLSNDTLQKAAVAVSEPVLKARLLSLLADSAPTEESVLQVFNSMPLNGQKVAAIALVLAGNEDLVLPIMARHELESARHEIMRVVILALRADKGEALAQLEAAHAGQLAAKDGEIATWRESNAALGRELAELQRCEDGDAGPRGSGPTR